MVITLLLCFSPFHRKHGRTYLARAHPPNELFITTFLGSFVELRYDEVRRIPIPRTWVNRRKRLQRDFSVWLQRSLTSAPPMIRSGLQRKNAIARSRGLEARPR